MIISASHYLPHAIAAEGCVPWMYLDTAGVVTVGVGHALETAAEAAVMPFVDKDGGLVPPEKITAAWTTIKAQRPGMLPEYYRPLSDIVLPNPVINDFAIANINEFLTKLALRVPGFDAFPPAAQLAILDMAFNLGVAGLLGKFPKLIAAIANRDWRQCAIQCHRAAPVSKARNAMVANWFMDAAGMAPQRPVVLVPETAGMARARAPTDDEYKLITQAIREDRSSDTTPAPPPPKPLAKSRTIIGGGAAVAGGAGLSTIETIYAFAYDLFANNRDMIDWLWAKAGAVDNIKVALMAAILVGGALAIYARVHDRLAKGR